MPVNASSDKLGWIAPNFNLLDISGDILSLDQLKGQNGTVIAFICNHCPYVIAIIQRLRNEAIELNKLNINTIAIMSNDTTKYPEDSYDNMKIFAMKYKINFPYLFDEEQNVAKDYHAVCTPDIYGFNKDNILGYRGRIDSRTVKSNDTKIDRELYEAMIKIKYDGLGPSKQNNSFGCSIKWK